MGRWLLALSLTLLLLPGALAAPAAERRLVSFEGAIPASLTGLSVLDRFPFARVALVEGSASALDRLAGAPGVAGVYPEEALTPELDRVRAEDRADAPAGDASWPTGAGVTVALVDSGVDASHPGFAGRMAAAVKLSKSGAVSEGGSDADGHGTHVAGILAGDGARSVNGRLHGLAPRARLVSVDISDSFTTTSAVRAFQWVHDHRDEHGIRVVSSSWGREKPDSHYDADDPVIRASDALVADGIVVVFSAGNRGRDGAATITTEGTNPNVLTVGSAAPDGRAEAYSSKGPPRDGAGGALEWVKPDLVAPGSGVLSARTTSRMPVGAGEEDRYYTVMNGTSMAAPQVAAAAAMLLEARPALTPTLVAAILQQTARDAAGPGPDRDTGFGMLDVRSAVDAVRAMTPGARAIPVATREPIHEEGSVAAAQGLVLASSGAPHVPPGDRVALPLLLPAGTTGVDLWFNWSGPGSFRVALDGDGGSWEFRQDGASSLRLSRPASPGRYQVTATPTGPVEHASFALDGSALVLGSRLVDEPAEFHARRGAPANGAFLVPESAAELLLDGVASEPWRVLAPLLLVSVAVAGAGTLPRRK